MLPEYIFFREGWSMGSNAEGINGIDPAPAKAGLWEDFVDIFYAHRRCSRAAPTENSGCLLFLVIVGTVLFFLTKNAIQPTNAAQGLFMSPESLTSMNSVGFSVGRFIDPDHGSAVAIALASRLDLFTIWVTVLLAVGLHVVGKISKQQAAIAAAITWAAGALPAVFGAVRGG